MSIDKDSNYNPATGGGVKGEMGYGGMGGGSVEDGLAGREGIDPDACRKELGMVPKGPNQAPSAPPMDRA